MQWLSCGCGSCASSPSAPLPAASTTILAQPAPAFAAQEQGEHLLWPVSRTMPTGSGEGRLWHRFARLAKMSAGTAPRSKGTEVKWQQKRPHDKWGMARERGKVEQRFIFHTQAAAAIAINHSIHIHHEQMHHCYLWGVLPEHLKLQMPLQMTHPCRNMDPNLPITHWKFSECQHHLPSHTHPAGS